MVIEWSDRNASLCTVLEEIGGRNNKGQKALKVDLEDTAPPRAEGPRPAHLYIQISQLESGTTSSS